MATLFALYNDDITIQGASLIFNYPIIFLLTY